MAAACTPPRPGAAAACTPPRPADAVDSAAPTLGWNGNLYEAGPSARLAAEGVQRHSARSGGWPAFDASAGQHRLGQALRRFVALLGMRPATRWRAASSRSSR
jgi:hypothetical protein